ncbi:hypothetical protein LY78DRAFT_20697 [Colletotrichum sublineola]|nr:hypothetical protein LY78DRAFT_20697 [Colletotrichum sublineola]
MTLNAYNCICVGCDGGKLTTFLLIMFIDLLINVGRHTIPVLVSSPSQTERSSACKSVFPSHGCSDRGINHEVYRSCISSSNKIRFCFIYFLLFNFLFSLFISSYDFIMVERPPSLGKHWLVMMNITREGAY